MDGMESRVVHQLNANFANRMVTGSIRLNRRQVFSAEPELWIEVGVIS